MTRRSWWLAAWAVAAWTVASMGAQGPEAKIEKQPYGKLPDGREVELYRLTNANGMRAHVINYGALLTELHVSAADGKPVDVVLGFDQLAGYAGDHPYFGATVGRVANRIAKGRFTLGGIEYQLAVNNGPNHLHGGKKGFDKVLWQAEMMPSRDGVAVRFSYTSPAGEEGYPGTLNAAVVYTLTHNNELRLEYEATCDAPTPVNLTHHSYFNLNGPAAGPVQDHELQILADSVTPTDENLIPTGQFQKVAGTPLDFTQPTPIGKRLSELPGEPGGYDHNYVLRGAKGQLRTAAVVRGPKTGVLMTLQTTEPGLQFYSGNFLDGTLVGKGGVRYLKHHGFCLEAQHFPDSINQPHFPSVVLKPGQTYMQTTIHAFTVRP
ncbi:MAG TPA: aldose epimerase family protein [Gemmatales bacterium]|nr:aldose epimerase family protein [Gemmatales bacterium]HMP58838.1 aldose epimerase family protein [Gemmatales bacterium]